MWFLRRDTDSVFVKLGLPPDAPMAEHFAKAKWLAEQISKTFRAPNDLESEKVYSPLLMIGKKRYAGLKYDAEAPPGAKPKMDSKGLQLVRRDTVPLARDASAGLLDAFLWRGSVEAAMEAATAAVRDLVNDRVPFEQLVLSKQLRGGYANPGSQPHLQVALKKKQRTGEGVPSGTRVQFVYLRDPSKADELLAARAEDPEYALERGLKLDVLHYLDSSVLTPLLTLLEPMIGADARERLLGAPGIAERIAALREEMAAETKVAMRVKKNAKSRQHEITNFFAKKARPDSSA